MFNAAMKTLVAGVTMVLALAATPAKAATSSQAVPLVLQGVSAPAMELTPVADAAADGKIWFAFKMPENMKPQLEEKKMLLILVGSFLPFGAVWGPIVLCGAKFDMEWALPALVWSFVFSPWIAPVTAMANLNRPQFALGQK